MSSSRQNGCALQNYSPMRSEWIPNGDAGVAATISKMKALITSPQGVRSWTVRQYTLDAVRGTERGLSEVEAVFEKIKADIEFRGEYGETLQSPEATINLGAGDCDDQAVLAATMLASLGHETRFKTVALRNSPDELSHVYVEVRDKRTGRWISVDPTVESSYPGWEPDDVARSESYGTIAPASGVSGETLVGLGFLVLGCLL
jgi:transglutaminase-like putative cysteine protease